MYIVNNYNGNLEMLQHIFIEFMARLIPKE